MLENYTFLRILLMVLVLCVIDNGVNGECEICQPANAVACHSENVFSVCVGEIPTYDNITCPEDYVCTAEPFVCYPKTEMLPACIPQLPPNRCNECDPVRSLFACLNETTIAFCFGGNTPNLESISYCPEDTVCDLTNTFEFCSESTKALASCRSSNDDDNTTVSTPIPTTTTESTTPTTTTTESTTPTTTTESTTPTTTTESTTPTTTTESTTPTTTTESTTPTTTTESTTPTTTTESTTPTTTTTTTTTESTTPTTTTESTTPTTTTEKTEGCNRPNSNVSYSVPNPADPTCKTFILCSGSLEYIRSCKANEYFSVEESGCVPDKPSYCE